MAVSWSTKFKWQTEYNADSVEWCPVESYRHLLVCGTYQLDKSDEDTKCVQQQKQKRRGRIYLLSITEFTKDISPIQTIDVAGILDQKWCYHTIKEYPVLAVVTSDGYVQLYRLVKKSGSFSLQLWIEDALGGDVLALSLDWSTNKTFANEPNLTVSDSSGSITVLRIVGNGLEKIGHWKSHSFEAWIAAFNYWNTNIFYSGSDDCLFKSYDVRVPVDAITTNRSHEAGVTAIRCHIEEEHQILTGSYDEKVRLWDTRHLKRCIAECDVNGGVWRLKWNPFEKNTVLVACMYGGFRIIHANTTINIIGEYLEHDSIAYGADWKFNDKTSLVATCSFYDCSLHISEVVL